MRNSQRCDSKASNGERRSNKREKAPVPCCERGSGQDDPGFTGISFRAEIGLIWPFQNKYQEKIVKLQNEKQRKVEETKQIDNQVQKDEERAIGIDL